MHQRKSLFSKNPTQQKQKQTNKNPTPGLPHPCFLDPEPESGEGLPETTSPGTHTFLLTPQLWHDEKSKPRETRMHCPKAQGQEEAGWGPRY